MRAMNDRLPSFCTPLDDRWPLPVALPGVQLRSTRFDPALLQRRLRPGRHPAAGEHPPRGGQRQAEFSPGASAHAPPCSPSMAAPRRRPSADHAPVWPAAISGSITHGDRWAAALVAARGDWRGLGLDVETLLEAERARYLHGEILTEGERLRFADDLERRTGLLVTLAFSLKESLFKALYPLVGKRFYFEHAELLEWRADGQARLRLLTDLSPGGATAASWTPSSPCSTNACSAWWRSAPDQAFPGVRRDGRSARPSARRSTARAAATMPKVAVTIITAPKPPAQSSFTLRRRNSSTGTPCRPASGSAVVRWRTRRARCRCAPACAKL